MEKNGYLHRSDGPAGIYPDGTKHWFLEGMLHREDGPAVVSKNGNIWFLNDSHLTREEWWATISDETKLKVIFNGEDF